MTENSKKEKTDDDTNTENETEMEGVDQEEGILVIDETPKDIEIDDDMTEEAPMDLTGKGEKSKETYLVEDQKNTPCSNKILIK